MAQEAVPAKYILISPNGIVLASSYGSAIKLVNGTQQLIRIWEHEDVTVRNAAAIMFPNGRLNYQKGFEFRDDSMFCILQLILCSWYL